MVAIITGDIVHSKKANPSVWMEELKNILSKFGENSKDWAIYRGDEFQLEITNYKEALHSCFLIKSYLKSKNIRVRLAIGIGAKSFESTKISERNGSAYYFSGTVLEKIKKEKITLAVRSENKKNDETFNLMLQLTNSLMDNWLTSSAKMVYLQFLNQEKSQEQLGTILNISQAAISKRTKRSHFELVKKVDLYYRENFIPN
ncbi:MAG: hypothetical protein ACI9XR_001157 [Flavobacterium sp.]|jgi:hypothetical protein